MSVFGAAKQLPASQRALTPAVSGPEALRIKQLYLRGLPQAAFDLIRTTRNTNPSPTAARAPVESPRAVDLDDRISHADRQITKVLGREVAFRDRSTFTLQRRGQHVPVGVIARDLKLYFWQRMFKGAVSLEQDKIKQRKKRKGEDVDAPEEDGKEPAKW